MNWRYVLFALSAILAVAYGAFGSSLYEGAPPYVVGTIFKASGIVVLVLIAALSAGGGRLERAASGGPSGAGASAAGGRALQPATIRNKLLAAGLLFGALGDALLAWSPDTFLYGAFAFLIGHLFYIALFLRTGIGVIAALKQAPRLIGGIALIIAAFVITTLLVPSDNSMFVPLSVYTGVLTLMALSSFTLPASRWPAMAGAVLFFVSDGFVAANLFHPLDDPTLAYWRSFAGWMIYWAGQAAICFGALGLHKR